MVQWLTGLSQPADTYYGDGATFMDDAPETPAPMFAFRAFQSAIFGTPKPVESKSTVIEPKEQRPQKKDTDTDQKPQPVQTTPQKSNKSDVGRMPPQEDLAALESVRSPRHEQLASPTKGILVTPGTAATRRKTVSFSARKEFRERTKSPDNIVELDGKSTAKKRPGSGQASQPQRKQTTLTKTLIELSTKRSSPPKDPTQSVGADTQEPPMKPTTKGENEEHLKPYEADVDVTVDLSKPRSRSGQHWKAEYDEYHRNSTRDLRRIIQYGQNVKSYAVKKDFEATSLNEKLQKELAKVARMEMKVSKLAKQLKMATAQGPEGENEQTRLVGELAQQTALAVRYQRKAEQYRKAIRRRCSHDTMEEQSHSMDENLLDGKGVPQDPFEVATLQAQLESLQETSRIAETRAAKLEAENKQLKRSLARVKESMASYDSRRQAREERILKQMDRHKTSKEKAEAELATLKVEHQRYWQASQVHEKDLQQSVPPASSFLAGEKGRQSARLQDTTDNTAAPPPTSGSQVRQPSLSSQKGRIQKTGVDIWAPSSPVDESESPTPNKGAAEFPPSSVKQDIHRALHEIENNLITSEQFSQIQATIGPKVRSHPGNLQSTAPTSPKQDMVDDLTKVPSSPQIQHTFPKSTTSPVQSTVGRSASLLSHRVGSRTSTVGSARTSSLSAERAAAAKTRLAERKMSAQKRAQVTCAELRESRAS